MSHVEDPSENAPMEAGSAGELRRASVSPPSSPFPRETPEDEPPSFDSASQGEQQEGGPRTFTLYDRPSEEADLTSAMPMQGRSAAAAPPVANTAASESTPERIGRFKVDRLLGEGAFGRVYLALDEVVRRQVAIKVPNLERIAHPQDLEAYIEEARNLARLRHPHIVQVYEAGGGEDGRCYIVSEYIEGSSLEAWVRTKRPTFEESARLTATIAEALHHAHTRGLVHRDVKPANILISEAGQPYVVDFGIALKHEDYGTGSRFAGTPAYMSPEQARNEAHRVDGRSDLFSLGVVFYELLVGQRPFPGPTRLQILTQIAEVDPRPPRQLDDTIPKELERICLKSLEKRALERYSTCKDLAEDLSAFLQGASRSTARRSADAIDSGRTEPPRASHQDPAPNSSTCVDEHGGPAEFKIVPKGLRSFDQYDADFFLELLPGARDRLGLPDSLRFWKQRVEERNPDQTFALGLIYGPSGCGKSSLLKAGLLPRLARSIVPVFLEATPDDTESRLLKGLRAACPGLTANLGLVESMTAVREGRGVPAGSKVLLVLDQFEQWLHLNREDSRAALIAALRQCDGGRLQAIVTVRDDFWMAATRLFRELEVRLVEGRNTAAVDLFDASHAHKVLAAFGAAHGRLPQRSSDLSGEQRDFLERAVRELARDGKVVPVRLALFAEMLKGKPWTPATLREVGGIEGVGVAFLEETFSKPTAPPSHRYHQRAAQSVLRALLPESGADIKGRMRSEAELSQAAGLADRPREFAELLEILDAELRLITPTDAGGDPGGPPSSERRHQLTHDYLVQSLRDWLTRKQRETRRGRAELRLAERADLWKGKPENRHLPSSLEWATIRALVARRNWTDPQRLMMDRAAQVHGRRAIGLLLVALLLAGIGIEGAAALRAANLVEALKTADTSDVLAILQRIKGVHRWADGPLRVLAESPDDASRGKLHASLALLPVDGSRRPFLERRLLQASPAESLMLRTALEPHADALLPKLWAAVAAGQPGSPGLLPASSALALYAPEDPRWAEQGDKTALALVKVNPLHLGPWMDALRPVRGKLAAPLAAIYRDEQRPDTERAQATTILTDYARDDAALVADLLMDAQTRDFAVFFPLADRLAAETKPLLRAELARQAVVPGRLLLETDSFKDHVARRQARAAAALARLGEVHTLAPLLGHGVDPRLSSFLVHWLAPLGVDPKLLAAELDCIPAAARPTPVQGPEWMDAVLFHPETSRRRALILALGTYGEEGHSAGERESLAYRLLDLYREDPDAGIHGAAAWTLGRWDRRDRLQAIDAELSRLKDWGERRWFINSQGQTFTVIEGPVEFQMGSPPTESDRNAMNEVPHQRRIPYRFAVGTSEVSWAEYQAALKDVPQLGLIFRNRYSAGDDGPVNGPSWFDAAAYCNWLSRKEGLRECYAPNAKGEYAEGMTIPADALTRDGYRLPTEAEWEYVCRAGAVTSRPHGACLELLGRYAWYSADAQDRTQPRGRLQPNALGVFDMLGNVLEWCQEVPNGYPRDRPSNGRNDQVGSRTSDDLIQTVDMKPRLLRGGSFKDSPAVVRSAHRSGLLPTLRSTNVGFRLARTSR